MKPRSILFIVFSFLTLSLYSVNSTKSGEVRNKSFVLATDITVAQFLLIDFKKLDESKEVKLNWLQKSILKSAQNRLTKKVNKGKLSAESKLYKNSKSSNGSKNTRGLLSLIFGGAGFLFMFLGPLAYLSLPLGIAALVLGILSLKKENNDTLGILGVVFGGLMILLFLVAIIWIAAVFGSF